MNRERRKRLEKIVSQIEELRDQLAVIQEEEQEAYDNLPDNLNDTDRATQLYDNASNLEDAASNLDDVCDSIRDIIES